MDRNSVITVMALMLLSIAGWSQTSVISFNLRYDNPNDAENWWKYRKHDVVALIAFYHPAIVGIQEGLDNQVAYIDRNLEHYSFIGVGREDGVKKGEYTAIFYDTTRFELHRIKTYWLSPTPDIVSIGWDAAMERIVTYGEFINKENRDTLSVFNCHFDHIGQKARLQSSMLLLDMIEELDLKDSQLIVMGDLNCEPQDEPIALLLQELDDAAALAEQPHYGPIGTFNSFNDSLIVLKKIDYILTKNLEISSHRHIDDRRDNNLFISDHYPVIVEINTERKKRK